MRIQIIFTLILFSLNATAIDDKSMRELFTKYDLVMDSKKVELIDEVFTKKFIKDSGGKKNLSEKISGYATKKDKQSYSDKMTWRKGIKGEIYFAKVKLSPPSDKKESKEQVEFIVLKEEGKPKIDGTISDGD